MSAKQGIHRRWFSLEQDQFCRRRQAFTSFQTWLPQVWRKCFPSIFYTHKMCMGKYFHLQFWFWCMVGSIAIHVGRCCCLVIYIYIYIYIYITRQQHLPTCMAILPTIHQNCKWKYFPIHILCVWKMLGKHFLRTWGSHVWKLVKACLLLQNWSCSRENHLLHYKNKMRCLHLHKGIHNWSLMIKSEYGCQMHST